MQKHMTLRRLLLLLGLLISIPAFYLVLAQDAGESPRIGRLLYALTAGLVAAELLIGRGKRALLHEGGFVTAADMAILCGTIWSALASAGNWSGPEWIVRLSLCGLIFARLMMLAVAWIAPNRLMQTLLLALVLLAVAGGGFYWLEPKVPTYADGLWLAFITGATVGYGDLVPSTPASRIFAGFIVLLGYALFSVVTASIAALFFDEDEKRIKRELHMDIKALRTEIVLLRKEILQQDRRHD